MQRGDRFFGVKLVCEFVCQSVSQLGRKKGQFRDGYPQNLCKGETVVYDFACLLVSQSVSQSDSQLGGILRPKERQMSVMDTRKIYAKRRQSSVILLVF